MKESVDILPYGLVRDLVPEDVAPDKWTSLSNVVMRSGMSERVGGNVAIASPVSNPPVWLLAVQAGPVAYLVYATLTAGGVDNLYVTDGVLHSDIGPLIPITGQPVKNRWSGGVLNGVPVFNWQQDAPHYWDLSPGTRVQPLPGWEANAHCASLRPFRNFLIALDYTDGGGTRIETLIKWSDAAEPGTVPSAWAPAPANDAGFVSAAGTAGACIDGAALRNQFIVYKQHSTYTLDYIGGQFVFALRKLFATTGILARNCVQEFRGKHAILTDGDFVITDGQGIESAIDKRLRRFIFANISVTNYANAFVAANKALNEIWICYPTGANVYPDTAVIWNLLDNDFGVREIRPLAYADAGVAPVGESPAWDADAGQWDQDATTWGQANFNPATDQMIGAEPATTGAGFGLVVFDVGDLEADGGPVSGVCIRESVDFGNGELLKTVIAVHPRITGQQGDLLGVQVGTQYERGQAITYGPVVFFRIGIDERVPVIAKGRYLSFRFASVAGAVWRMAGFSVELGNHRTKF